MGVEAFTHVGSLFKLPKLIKSYIYCFNLEIWIQTEFFLIMAKTEQNSWHLCIHYGLHVKLPGLITVYWTPVRENQKLGILPNSFIYADMAGTNHSHFSSPYKGRLSQLVTSIHSEIQDTASTLFLPGTGLDPTLVGKKPHKGCYWANWQKWNMDG